MNVNGALFTAQAAGQQMERFGGGGSIIMIASVSGHLANKVGFVEAHILLSVLIFSTFVAFFWIGLRMAVVQHLQVGCAPDGAYHGV